MASEIAPNGVPALVSNGLADHESEPVIATVAALGGTGAAVDSAMIDAAARAWSANTKRAFLSDLGLWSDWCRANRVRASDADARLVADWVRALGGLKTERRLRTPIKKRAPATIARYLVHVGMAYRMAGLADPTAAPLVKLELKAMRRARGTRQRQAKGIRYKGDIADLDGPPTGVCLSHLLNACRRDWLGLRDAALLRVAYDTACRRSELVAIEIDHIEAGEGGAGVLFIPSSKTDAEGEGAYAYLSPVTMQAIRAWKRAVDIRSGPLLRRVEVHFDGSVSRVGNRPLHPNSITLIYRRLVRAAHAKGLLGEISEQSLERWVGQVSSHSIRVGVAQDNFAAGEGLPAIMQAYRWRDPATVMRYGARLAAQSGASARLAKRFASG
ncbi:tyrosine-type recombinase/integrase [Croceicoccus sp. F390]|uniref:Tyrosine-type recombinase/integrase n=1 Tax=Croceicoccus esteveae TaxID=3075597 RepID=A0ABU2ZID2_9SPHN|nr:tyrosine-type recombinase/integrase [Croceicoccus sp. F390]MDT0576371.1 tyrosine-type recombinase/integrase [Croceicoccus sp. F390]